MGPLALESVAEFKRNLEDTATWCGYKATEPQSSENAASVLDAPNGRKLTIHPNIYWSQVLDPHLKVGKLPEPSVAELEQAIGIVQNQRRSLLASKKSQPVLVEGKLLRTRFQDCYFDTAPKWVSNGFFNNGDLPPWDTWIWCAAEKRTLWKRNRRAELISWVPKAWWPVVNEGIDASPTNTNVWEETVNDELTNQLRTAGVIGLV